MKHSDINVAGKMPTSIIALSAQFLIALIILSIPFEMRGFGWITVAGSAFGWAVYLLQLHPKAPVLIDDFTSKQGLYWFGLCLLYLLFHVVQIKSAADLERLNAPSRLILLSGIIFLPSLARRGPSHFSIYFSVSGIIFFLIPLIQYIKMPGSDRFFGLFQYKNLMALAAMINAVMIIWYNDGRSKIKNFIHILGITGSLIACFFSGTRAAWILFPFIMVPAYLMYAHSSDRKHLNRKLELAFLVTCVTIIFLASDIFFQRVNVSLLDIKNSLSGDLSGSIGLRLMMIEMSWEKIQLHPLLGNGLADFHNSIVRWADTMQIPPTSMERGFQNPHNQYLHWAVALGLPAAIICIFISLIWPILVTRDCDTIARGALWCFLVCCFIFLFTEAVLDRHQGSIWYTAILSIMIGFCFQTRRSIQILAGQNSIPRYTKSIQSQ